jgi:hypothetical protein
MTLLVEGKMLSAKKRVNLCDPSSMEAVKKGLKPTLSPMKPPS